MSYQQPSQAYYYPPPHQGPPPPSLHQPMPPPVGMAPPPPPPPGQFGQPPMPSQSQPMTGQPQPISGQPQPMSGHPQPMSSHPQPMPSHQHQQQHLQQQQQHQPPPPPTQAAMPPPPPPVGSYSNGPIQHYPPQQQQQHQQHQHQQHQQHQQQQHYRHLQGGPMPYGVVGQPPAPAPKQTKLDQHAMPSSAQLVNDEIEVYKKSDRQLNFTAPASLPPLVSTLESQTLKMSLQDGGCVRPCHMRSSIYHVPINKDMLESSGLEFSVVVKPFDDGEVEGKFYVPLSLSEVKRCNRCKAYANPFSKNGQCCICNMTLESMQELNQNPELNLGSYEFRVSKEYYRAQIEETRRPHIIFAIEMTANSRHLVHYVAKNLAGIIKSHFPVDFQYTASLSPLVGFITYNSKITVYDVIDGGHAYVISDMTSVTECACTSKFLVDPAENFAEIEKFLNSLAGICDELVGVEQQTVLGPVIEAALTTCLYDTSNNFTSGDQKKAPNPQVVPAGKLYILHSTLPTHGDESTPGRLSTKRNIDDMKRQLGTDNESKTLAPEGKYYTQLAQKCISDYASGVELFLFPPHPRAYMNISTIGELSKLTGTGVINKYHISSLENFKRDLQISLKSTMGFDATLRVRTSTGISPVKYIGNFSCLSLPNNLEMSTVNTNSNFIVQIKYDDKLPENDLVIVQFAMIYTSVCGERRVRVHNLALTTCQTYQDLYKSACCDTLVNVLVRDTVDKMRAGTLTPKVAKEQLMARCINVLSAYRKYCTENQPNANSQLILPEGLKLLPVYLCGALKCDAIDGGMEMFPDDKALAQLNLLGALPSMTQVTVNPRMYSIETCEADDEENEYGLSAVLRRCFYLAIEEEKGQCYVLENGYYLFIFFPSTELGQSFLSNVFGIRKDDPDLLWDLRQKETNETKFLEELIEQITKERRRALKISVVRQNRDKMEHVFKTFLYEDKKRPDGAGVTSKLDNASYVDILCYLHSEIRSKLSQ